MKKLIVIFSIFVAGCASTQLRNTEILELSNKLLKAGDIGDFSGYEKYITKDTLIAIDTDPTSEVERLEVSPSDYYSKSKASMSRINKPLSVKSEVVSIKEIERSDTYLVEEKTTSKFSLIGEEMTEIIISNVTYSGSKGDIKIVSVNQVMERSFSFKKSETY